jgi:hypothetical protein
MAEKSPKVIPIKIDTNAKSKKLPIIVKGFGDGVTPSELVLNKF